VARRNDERGNVARWAHACLSSSVASDYSRAGSQGEHQRGAVLVSDLSGEPERASPIASIRHLLVHRIIEGWRGDAKRPVTISKTFYFFDQGRRPRAF
jgi:hypothetical protein